MDKRLYCVALLSVIPCPFVFAAEGDSSVEKEDVLVISASRTEQTLWNSPVTMQVVDREQLSKFGGDSITEALRDIPGVLVSDYALPGRKQVRIRGEKSDRVLVLIDGQEVSYQRLNGAGLLIDSESVERIEVVKGPHSVLYGARAIGGVINFITRKGGERPIQGDMRVGYDTSTEGNFQSGSLYGSVGGFDYRISGSRYDYGDRKTPDGTLKNTDFSNDSVSSWLGYRWDAHRLGVSLERFELDSKTFTSPEQLSYPIVDFSVEIPKLLRKKAGVFYDYEHDGAFWKKLHLDVYQQEISRQFRNNMVLQPTAMMKIDQKNRVDDEQKTEGGTLQFDFTPFTDHSLIIGTQYQRDRVDQASLIRSTTYVMGTPRPTNVTESSDKWQQTSWSAFAQNEWQMNEDWIWSVGARQYWLESKVLGGAIAHIKESSSDNTLVAATSLRYSGFDDTELRLSYAQGYVYPTLFQQFAQSAAGGKTTYGNPNLKAEYSQNIEFGARYKGNSWLIDSAVYYSAADDYITSSQCTSSSSGICQGNSGSNFQYYTNADKAKTYGIEAQIEYHGWDIVPYISGNLLKRQFNTNGKKTYRTGDPTLTGRIGVKNSRYFNQFDLDSDFYIRAAGKSRDHTALSVSDYENKSGWATANLEFNGFMGSERQYRVGLQLNNLADKRYTTARETVPASGFHAVFSAGMKF
jgi:hemoglobin/transferrin/lactoferrin receptor protein